MRLHRLAGRGIEPRIRLRHPHQHFAGIETACVFSIEQLQLLYDRRRAQRIHVAVWPATEWWKTDAEHSSHVAVARLPHDSLLQAAHRLVHHGERAPALDLLLRQLHSPAPARKELVDGPIHAALLSVFVVEIESLLSLPAEPTRGEHPAHRVGWTESLTE